MNEHAKHLSKPVALSAISTVTVETVELVDELTHDGRFNLVEARPPQPGGLCIYAPRSIRKFDVDAEVVPGGLVGGLDQREAVDFVQRLGLATRYLIPVPRKFTNRSRVSVDRQGSRQIVRLGHAITFEQDLTAERRQWLLGLVAQSRASVIGNLPLEFTEEAIEFGRQVGTYVGLAAGDRVLGRLRDLRPHALFLNFDEACRAVGFQTDDADRVFESLQDATSAEHVVVMTGNGQRPTYIAERLTGRTWKLDPIDVAAIPERDGFLNPLGCGDMLAGTVTRLLGMPRRLLTGEPVFESVRFGQEVATAHLSGSPWAAKQLRARFAEIRFMFEPQAEAARAEQAA